MKAIIETKRINGKPAHRLAGSPEGAWLVEESEIDAMLNRVQRELNIRAMAIYEATGIPNESVSRCRRGRMPISDKWILRLSDFSGIPVAELRQVACIEPTVHPHGNARKAPQPQGPGRLLDGVQRDGLQA